MLMLTKPKSKLLICLLFLLLHASFSYAGITSPQSNHPNSNPFPREPVPQFSPSGSPASAQAGPQISLYEDITPASVRVSYWGDFAVHTNFYNSGTADFEGDYCSALFDSADQFVAYGFSYNRISLPADDYYNNGIEFTGTGSDRVMPGVYTLRLFYRVSGGDWVPVSDYNGHHNAVKVTIVNTNKDFFLYAPVSLSGGDTLVPGKGVWATLDVFNNTFDDFDSSLSLNICYINGNLAQNIEQKDKVEIDRNMRSGRLYFSTPYVSLDPGVYYIVLSYMGKDMQWHPVGPGKYANPIRVIVPPTPLDPDRYEVNNTESQAYNLAVNFTRNQADVSTQGSNFHTAQDIDYYKVVLSKGYDYTLNARVDDRLSSTSGIRYTANAWLQYKISGQSWSDTFDAALPDTLYLTGGDTVCFRLSHHSGETGTYLFYASLSRKAAVHSDIAPFAQVLNIQVYPNPACDILHIDMGNAHSRLSQVQLMDMQGRVVQTVVPAEVDGHTELSLDGIANGVYILHLYTDNGLQRQKVVVNR